MLPHESTGAVDLLCRFAVENREQDKKSCSLFFVRLAAHVI